MLREKKSLMGHLISHNQSLSCLHQSLERLEIHYSLIVQHGGLQLTQLLDQLINGRAESSEEHLG